MKWKTRNKQWDLSQKSLVMGILNVTPDSFSDGGNYQGVELALQHAQELLEAGAEILDIGGESTRPGFQKVEAEEEIRRVLPVVEALVEMRKREGKIFEISVDTSKSEVASAVLAAGADIINDVNGLEAPGMAEICQKFDAGVVVMHSGSGNIKDVEEYFAKRLEKLEQMGISREKIAIDPGLGFGKDREQNRELIVGIGEFLPFACPILIGISRKRFLGEVTGKTDPKSRDVGTAVVAYASHLAGARIHRVHNVSAVKDALALAEEFGK